MKQLYRDLVDLPGIAGHEKYIRAYMKKHMEPFAEKIYQDKLGSIFASLNENSNGPTVMIAGHMDEVGAMVTEITEKGYLKMIPIGSINPPIVLSQQMQV
ncbi:MAG: peptidase M28, partial [Candidatus Izemoplasmatales bacterium]|nr:peptidase M28 [Candidatus Izemoplasmatales bacterium]